MLGPSNGSTGEGKILKYSAVWYQVGMGPEERSFFFRPLESYTLPSWGDTLSKPCMGRIQARKADYLLKGTTSEVPGREDLACDGPSFLIAMLCYRSSRTACQKMGGEARSAQPQAGRGKMQVCMAQPG